MEAFELPALEPSGPVGIIELEDTLSAARSEADAIREAAYAEGMAQAQAQIVGELQPAATALVEALRGVHEEAAAVADRSEAAAVELAFAIAAQVLGGALDVKPELVVTTVRGALRRLVARERVSVLVNPADLEVVRAAVPGLLAELGGMEHCDVQAERRVDRGGAIVRTEEGEVDATLRTRLERARAAVSASLRGEASEEPAEEPVSSMHDPLGLGLSMDAPAPAVEAAAPVPVAPQVQEPTVEAVAPAPAAPAAPAPAPVAEPAPYAPQPVEAEPVAFTPEPAPFVPAPMPTAPIEPSSLNETQLADVDALILDPAALSIDPIEGDDVPFSFGS
jgi:flagellar assembly protein FliH